MRVSTKLTIVFVAIMASVLAASSYVFLQTTDKLTHLLRSNLTDTLLPVREAQLAHRAFDRMNYDARGCLNVPEVGLDEQWSRLAEAQAQFEHRLKIAEDVLLTSSADENLQDRELRVGSEDPAVPDEDPEL